MYGEKMVDNMTKSVLLCRNAKNIRFPIRKSRSYSRRLHTSSVLRPQLPQLGEEGVRKLIFQGLSRSKLV